jgi:hypothetical protein
MRWFTRAHIARRFSRPKIASISGADQPLLFDRHYHRASNFSSLVLQWPTRMLSATDGLRIEFLRRAAAVIDRADGSGRSRAATLSRTQVRKAAAGIPAAQGRILLRPVCSPKPIPYRWLASLHCRLEDAAVACSPDTDAIWIMARSSGGCFRWTADSKCGAAPAAPW